MKNTLKNKIIIDKIFMEGKNFKSKNLVLKNIEGEDVYMVTVSSKKFKRAVDRNRIKRLLRETIRGSKIKGSFVLIYIGEGLPNLIELKKEFDGIKERIGG